MPKKPSKRHRARCLLIQALYQWQVSGETPYAILQQFKNQQDYHQVDTAYFDRLLMEIPQKDDVLCEKLHTSLDRAFDAVAPIEQAILRLGCYELLECQEIPYRVVLNEAVELGKYFGSDTTHKYVNGVMDKLATVCRPLETQSDN